MTNEKEPEYASSRAYEAMKAERDKLKAEIAKQETHAMSLISEKTEGVRRRCSRLEAEIARLKKELAIEKMDNAGTMT